MVVDNVNMLWETLDSAYLLKLTLNIFKMREYLWSVKLQDCGDVDNYTSQIDRTVKDYTVCAGPATTDTDAADTDTATTMAELTDQEHLF